MPDGYRYEASFGGVRIDVISTRSQGGRRVFPHEFPKKSGAATEDQGAATLIIDLEFVFIDRQARQGELLPIGDYQERFEQFSDLLLEDPVRTLVHPYLGQIRCRISDFSTRGTGDGSPAIFCSATFTEDSTEPPILDIVDGGIQSTAGEQSVREATNSANAALEDRGLSSTLPNEAAALSANWSVQFELTTREVQTQMAELNARLDAELASFEIDTDPLATPLLQAYTLLQYRLRKAAEAFSTTTPRIIEITTTETVPLRAVVADFYGATEADRRFLEVIDLNPTLRTPACVPPRTTIKAYARNVRPREFRQV